MNVSDFILDFLASKGVRHVFGVTGGMIVPLFDAFSGRKDIRYICTQTEQAAAMAADGYARFAGLGVTLATSGPGATNLLTGIGCSYFDSIPTIHITGNVNTHEQKGNSGIRQRGFQETDIVSIVKPITKYARQINDPKDIQYALEAAYWYATSNRPGPVLLDIPIDVQQAAMPEPSDVPQFVPPRKVTFDISQQVNETVDLMLNAKRPVIIYGAGCRNARAELLEFIEKTGIPCLPSWAAIDLIPHDHPLFVGQFGVYGSRYANLAVQNADLVIAIGTRLDTRMTGGKFQTFAPSAVKVVCDIDIHEATKAVKADVLVLADAGEFLRAINNSIIVEPYWYPRTIIKRSAWDEWYDRIAAWKLKYPIIPPSIGSKIQPLSFVSQLCDALPNDAIVVADAGANLTWTMQAIQLRGAQRLWSDFGFSSMGYALPAAIGAYFATGKPITCIIGDGGMQMNIQELQTLKHYNIPVKVFILNNRSYGIIKQMQEEICQGRYEGTDDAGGYSVPDFQRIAAAYGLQCYRINNPSCTEWMPERVVNASGPFLCDVKIDPDARLWPKCQFGNSLENQSPLLPPDEVAENMEILERF